MVGSIEVGQFLNNYKIISYIIWALLNAVRCNKPF